MDKLFNIVFTKLIQWLTPHMLRKPNMLSWIRVVISPVTYVYNNLLRFRQRKQYELSITPQVFSLEKMLNDKYDPVGRHIYITDPEEKDPVYLFTDDEQKDEYVFADSEDQYLYLFVDSETTAYLDDFIVLVPYDLVYNYNEMRSLINNYKLASKQYKISS